MRSPLIFGTSIRFLICHRITPFILSAKNLNYQEISKVAYMMVLTFGHLNLAVIKVRTAFIF